MKKTIIAKIGEVSFTIDEDAYMLLNNYLDDINSRLAPYESAEVLYDLEVRLADIFRENLMGSLQVVTTAIVKRAIAILGDPCNFGYRKRSGRDYDCRGKLYRSRTQGLIGGVCVGIADYFNIDPTLVRLLTVLLVVFGGLSIWVYIIFWIIIPQEPRELNKNYFRNECR